MYFVTGLNLVLQHPSTAAQAKTKVDIVKKSSYCYSSRCTEGSLNAAGLGIYTGEKLAIASMQNRWKNGSLDDNLMVVVPVVRQQFHCTSTVHNSPLG